MSPFARALATAVFALAWGAVALGQAPAKRAPAPPASQLEPIEVLGNPEPLDQELARLRRKVRDSTPCLGCDSAAGKARDSAAKGAFFYFFMPAEPVEPTREQKDAAYARCIGSGPGMDYLC